MSTPPPFATNFPPLGQDLIERGTSKVDRTWALFFQHLAAGVPAGGAGGLTEHILNVLEAAGGSGAADAGYWTPITNGDPVVPEILFDSAGDCIVGFVPTP